MIVIIKLLNHYFSRLQCVTGHKMRVEYDGRIFCAVFKFFFFLIHNVTFEIT